jgi:hypothetical protein
MKNRLSLRSAALLVALALAAPAFAKPVSKTIQISRTARFGKTELSAGEYRLLIDGNKVLVKKGNNTLAEVEARWEERAAKAEYDSVEIAGDGQVQVVGFAGEKRVLVFIR